MSSNIIELKPLKVDFKEAERFLSMIDGADKVYCFQTFDDRKGHDSPKLNRVFIDKFDNVKDKLESLNKAGAGVFVLFNLSDGKGRKKKNITGVRGLLGDFDRPGTKKLPLDPHIVVETSPNKFQTWVFVDGLTFEDFDGMQTTVIDEYGSDRNAKDLARVLRLPGFNHRKDPKNPFRSRIVHESGQNKPYTADEVKKLIPPTLRTTRYDSPDQLPRNGKILRPATVRSALNAIDPDIDYMDWLKCGMALHYECRGSEEGFLIWDEWSANGALYENGETIYRWNTFDKKRRVPVTFGTLLFIASEHGWNGAYLDDDEGIRLAHIEKDRLLKDFGSRVGIAMVEGKALCVYRQKDGSLNKWDTQFAGFESMIKRYENDFVPIVEVKENKPTVIKRKDIFNAWRFSKYRRNFDRVEFQPIKGLVASSNKLPRHVSGNAYNLYQGLTFEPVEGDCRMILEHIKTYWCRNNPEHFQYTIKWLAAVFQRPDRPGEVAIALKSFQGAGKNTVIDIITDALGSGATSVTKPEQVTGQFNDHLGTSVFVFLNEAIWGGDRKHEGTLKSLITDKTLRVERKYVPGFYVRNCCHLMLSTNNDWFAPMDIDDRRFFVLECDNSRIGDFEYFDKLHAHIDNGGKAAFIHYLLNEVDLTGFRPREMPQNNSEVKLENKLRTACGVTQWWFECLQNHEIVGLDDFGDESRNEDWAKDSIFLIKSDFFEAYRRWAERRKLHPGTQNSQTRKLKELIGSGFNSRAQEPSGRRRAAVVIPCIEVCRDVFQNRVKQDIEW